VGFWNLPREPGYDATLIAVWRLYARLHDRLADYSLRQADLAHRTGLPIVRPLMLADPGAPAAWTHWQTYLYGPDLLVTPIWEPGLREQQVYLPSGSRWRNAWKPGEVLDGGRVVTVAAPLHQVPLFVRVGATVDLGDLEREWAESRAAAEQRPDLARLDGAVRLWFDGRKSAPGR
jgi:alpha-D-xyloside xylohydrolase